jgi:Domain of unknown function (DUF1835)
MDIIESGLHIINGLSAAGIWKQSFHRTERLLVQQDMLSYGPTLACENLEQWKKTRLAFLKSIYTDWDDFFEGYILDLLTNTNRLHDYEYIYIWVGTGIQDQLLIFFVIYIAEISGADLNEIRLVQFENILFGNYQIGSTGQLNVENMSNYPPPTALTQSDIEYIKSAWSALTSSTPKALQDFVYKEHYSLPYMQKAIQNILRRYPSKSTGLTYWDWKLLENVHKYSPNTARIIGHTMAGDLMDDGVLIGDDYFFFRLCELSNAKNPQPLIKLVGNLSSMRETKVTLTVFGRSVVEGNSSSYPVNPIDEWIGGVHLSSENGNLWFYEEILGQ